MIVEDEREEDEATIEYNSPLTSVTLASTERIIFHAFLEQHKKFNYQRCIFSCAII
jgi:hypothetical protein